MTHTPSQSDGSMTIGDLAKAAGVNVETIRFYQRKGEWLLRQLDYELTEVMRRAKKIKVEPFHLSTRESNANK